MSKEKEKKLTYTDLTTGLQDAVYATGIVVSQAFKKMNTVVLAVDELGRIKLMPPNSVRVLSHPRVDEDDLDELTEEEAIEVLTKQGDKDEQIINYLKGRDERLGAKEK